MKLGLAAAAVTVVVALSPAAYAIEGQTQVSSRRVAVGEPFNVQLSVTFEGQGSPTAAGLPLPSGMSASGPSSSSGWGIVDNNGHVTRTTTVTLSWQVVASKVGSFKIGPPTMAFDAQRVQGQPVQIEVVAANARRAPTGRPRGFPPGFPFDFTSPLGGMTLPRSLFDDDPAEAQPEEPKYPDELRVDKAPDPVAFLRVTATPHEVVVGEQVTLKVLAYGGRGLFNFESTKEASAADFITLKDDSRTNAEFYRVPVGDAQFIALKLRELALFPLYAGKQRVGNFKMGFAGRGYPQDQAGKFPYRESNWVDIVVSEPPLRGRPPGYKIGDVGNYTLSANVEPRQVVAGDSVAVVATLSGVGNVPFKIQNPEAHGVEWAEPSLSEKVELRNAVVQGSRTFSYVVRLAEAGKVDLGELTLPYYNPETHAYATARAKLGVVEVKPNPKAASASAEQKPNDRLAGILQPRNTLGAPPSARAPLSDRGGFWAALLLAPFGVVFAGGALNAMGRMKEKLRARGTSLSAQLEHALRDARELAKRDSAGSVAAVERAVFLAIELKLGLKARAILKSGLAANLTARGLSEARARALAQLLEDCDTLRFVGSASGVEPAELAQRAAKNSAEMRDEKLSAQT